MHDLASIAEPAPRRPGSPRGSRNAAVTREIFEAEIFILDAALPAMFGNAHGDRVVALALANPLAKTASPSHILATLTSLKLPPGRLWQLFKACGGVSKEEPSGDGTPECEQFAALGDLWARLMQNRVDDE